MAVAELPQFQDMIRFLPTLKRLPGQSLWVTYDPGADVLYVNFAESRLADDSEMTEDDVIVRYSGEEVVGYTVLRASQR